MQCDDFMKRMIECHSYRVNYGEWVAVMTITDDACSETETGLRSAMQCIPSRDNDTHGHTFNSYSSAKLRRTLVLSGNPCKAFFRRRSASSKLPLREKWKED